ncbi:hypothetical protein KC207_07555 [Phycicoccus sp. BSK3Z-2]|uniref:Uncharacterized protein n=1 Tax=Phycicoccus avicenniae TaxID=2828860 RepID=A0A941D6S3_9MICO|nr:hypothetical protein [Phycicoccus avicenniae]MBR7743144.1 hypothetical protein [Phycicoccus avicenniae]
MTAQRWSDDLGSVADEAGRLLESLRRAGQDAAEQRATEQQAAETTEPSDGPSTSAPDVDADTSPRPIGRSSDTGGSDGGTGEAPFSCDDPVCQWCPVCRASAFVRRLSPETLSGLSELAGFAATVLGDLASARERERDRTRRDPEDEAFRE